MSATLHLYRLQQVDSQIDKVQNRLDEIQRIIEDSRELKLAKALVEKNETVQQRTAKVLKKAENDVQAQHIKIEQTEAMLYGGTVKNPKEVQDLQNKAESLKRHLSTLQDVQLEAMLVHEETNEALQHAEKALKELRAKLIQQNSELGGEQTVLNKDMDRLLKERDAALPDISADALAIYAKLRKQKNGFAVASVMDNGCSACGGTLTSAQQQKARTSLSYCPTCKRIVYVS